MPKKPPRLMIRRTSFSICKSTVCWGKYIRVWEKRIWVSSQINRRSFILSALATLPAGKLLGQTPRHSESTPWFEDITASSGIRFKHESSRTSQKYLPESMGAGVAMFDYDNDGWLDLFFVNGALIQDPMPRGATADKSDPRFWHRLYRTNRDGTFPDATEKAGLQGHSNGMGAATGDYANERMDNCL